MKDYCLILLTKNRAEAVDNFLEETIEAFKHHNIDVIVYDSSDDNMTRTITEKYFYRNEKSSLIYEMFDNDGSDKLGGDKAIAAIKKYKDNYRYIWFCGDNTVVQIDRVFTSINEAMKNECDFIHIYRNSYHLETGYYDNCVQVFKYFNWSMTHMCSIILSSKLAAEIVNYTQDYRVIPLAFMFNDAIFTYIAKNKFKMMYIKDELFKVSKFRTVSTVHQQGRIIEVWGKKWCEEIEALPSIYDSEKEYVKKSLSDNIGLFSYYGILKLRASGNLQMETLIKYKKYLVQVTDTKYGYIYFVSILPKRMINIFISVVDGCLKLCVYIKRKALGRNE